MRAVALLLVLLGLAALAVPLLRAFDGNCKRIVREAALAEGALQFCAQTLGCRYEWRDLVAVTKQRQAAERCFARTDP